MTRVANHIACRMADSAIVVIVTGGLGMAVCRPIGQPVIGGDHEIHMCVAIHAILFALVAAHTIAFTHFITDGMRNNKISRMCLIV